VAKRFDFPTLPVGGETGVWEADMYRVIYRKSPQVAFKALGYENQTQWYSQQDAAEYADALQKMVYQAYVADENGRMVYDAMSRELTR